MSRSLFAALVLHLLMYHLWDLPEGFCKAGKAPDVDKRDAGIHRNRSALGGEVLIPVARNS